MLIPNVLLWGRNNVFMYILCHPVVFVLLKDDYVLRRKVDGDGRSKMKYEESIITNNCSAS